MYFILFLLQLTFCRIAIVMFHFELFMLKRVSSLQKKTCIFLLLFILNISDIIHAWQTKMLSMVEPMEFQWLLVIQVANSLHTEYYFHSSVAA
jgi:hypothetical protein